MTRDIQPGPVDDHDAAEREAQATAWFVRLKEPSATAADRQAFRKWLSESPHHHDAFNAVKRLWASLEDPAAILGQGAWYRDKVRDSRFGWAWAGIPTVVGALCCVIVAGMMLWRDPGLAERWRADVSTPPGSQRQVRLPDGSAAVLDGDTALDLRFTGSERTVVLRRGRVWFDVAHGSPAPFLVRIGDLEIRDVGTAFAVDQDGPSVEVTVEHGLVAVSAPGGQVAQVPADHAVDVVAGHIGPVAAADVRIALAWQRGLIILDRAPVGAVVDQLRRMQPGRVLIPDEGIRRMVLSGVFRANDPAAVIEALHSALGLKTLAIPGWATLIYR